MAAVASAEIHTIYSRTGTLSSSAVLQVHMAIVQLLCVFGTCSLFETYYQ